MSLKNYQVQEKKNYAYNDIQHFPNITTDQCAQECDKLSNCIGFVTQGVKCWLKSKRENESNNSSTNYYEKINIPNYQLESKRNYPYNDIKSFQNSSPQQCAQECDKESKCVGYIYDTRKICWLKSIKANGRDEASSNFYEKKKIIQPAKTYTLQSTDMDNSTYYPIFCPSGFKNPIYANQMFDTAGQDIISNEKTLHQEECSEKCEKDKTCKAYQYQKSTQTCTQFRSFPTKLTPSNLYDSGIRLDEVFNANQLSSTQKENVKKFCLQQKYQELYPTSKDEIQNCQQGIKKNSKNQTYIDLNRECVWNKIQTRGKGKIKNKSTFGNTQKLGETKRSSTIDTYSKNWDSFQTSKKELQQKESSLQRFRPSFLKANMMNHQNFKKLNLDLKETSQNTLENQANLQIEKQNAIGKDTQVEGFTNPPNQWIHWILIILFIFVILSYLSKNK